MTGLMQDHFSKFRRRRSSLPKILAKVAPHGRRFSGDARGVGVVEFSLIVPAMLLIYCALGELANALETSRKVGQFTRTIADLIGRETVTSTAAVYEAAGVIMQPYDASRAQIRVSAMGVYKYGNTLYAIVCSSDAKGTSARERYGTTSSSYSQFMAAPEGFRYEGARYIMAEVNYTYQPVLGAVFFKWINKNTIAFQEGVTWPERPDKEIVLPAGKACY